MESDFKAVIMHGFSAEEALAVMRAVKAASAPAAKAAFATTTKTSVEWKVSYLLEHLEEEHTARMAAIAAQSASGGVRGGGGDGREKA